ncbi:ferritin-like domain-containing protein [Amycolatopsis sp. PS_44_ISF1]|uniref:ferritin-like domain-containing protein n=1 Tax=Amycolatopsis sp. PS_44_ISF1 TaxID=2974917 RepID=UPI0028DD4E2D|nr:ferritin-like domain-containing protein [Amycolatopsis sp. PS_44_ISF1]MDT8914261.1 ferritin-like domain-containing protein [Amycolatopsis sp. PS_44_ISF1]
MDWLEEFTVEAQRRQVRPEPEWDRGARLDPAVARSVQRFQVGESGDGANLLAKADGRYQEAVALFVAEEQNHARLLARLLEASGTTTIDAHWSDAVFVQLRRALGLRLELMVLLIAEVVALRYYRALRDGVDDPLTREVAARILADEERHVPFHCDRLHGEFGGPTGKAVAFGWRVLLAGALAVVLLDHGSALRKLGLTRIAFAAGVLERFERVLVDVHCGRNGPARVRPWPRRARPRGLV